MIFLDERGSRLEARGTRFNARNVILSVAKNPGRMFLIAVLVAVSASFAARKTDSEEQARIQDSLKQVELQNLQREVESLTRIRLQKADSLEKLEAAHWSKRYAESKMTEEHQVETRELDGRYSKLSTDLGRVSEEVQSSKSVTAEAEENARAEEDAFESFNTQIKLSIDKSLEEVTGDYPVGMDHRLISLKKMQKDAAKKNPNTMGALRGYALDLLNRHELTYTQSFGPVKTQVGNRPDVNVYRLRLGTVFLGEAATDNGEIQALLRTGALQGKRYEWNSSLPKDMNDVIRTAINTAYSGLSKSNTVTVDIPMDVLQNKAIRNAIAGKEQGSLGKRFTDWFKKGGIVMYPLSLVAIFALLLALERFIVLSRRGHLGRRFAKRLEQLLQGSRFEEAANLCLRYDTSLAMVLFAVLNKANDTRENAERSLQEALLREQPKLERRMGLLAAMGTIAPLLGLLGTVTGIITLFTVITEVGTNDARVLAGGISEALVTTETGLVIAIPVMIIHGLLSEKIEKVTSELYMQSMALMNRIFDKEK